MNLYLLCIRYCFILIAIIGTLYIIPISSYTTYTFMSLLYMALIQSYQRWGQQKWEGLFFILQTGYIYFLCMEYPGGLMYILYFSTLFSLQPRREYRFQLLFITLQGIVMNLSISTYTPIIIILSNLMYLFIVAILVLIRNTAKQRDEIQFLYDSLRRNHYELEDARSRVIEYAKKVENIAQIEERNRISKDIHDDIGHSLIRIKMMAEAVIRLIPHDLAKGMNLLYQIRDHLDGSMETLRETVRKLKPNEMLLKSFSLTQLAQDFEKDSGVKVDFKTRGNPYNLYPSAEVALFRNLQEAFSNAVSHAQAKQVSVELIYSPNQVELVVANELHSVPVQRTKGLGIKGMEERVELLGGYIEVEADKQFVIRTILPLQTERL